MESHIDTGQEAETLAALEKATGTAEAELNGLASAMREYAPDKAAIFDAHLSILHDIKIKAEIVHRIQNEHVTAEWAILSAYSLFIKIFEAIDDPIIKERASDLKDVRDRLLRCCAGIQAWNLICLPEEVVIFAKDLFPSDTAQLDRKKVLAIVTDKGNDNSHTAILAKSLGIPAVLGVSGLLEYVKNDMVAVVDAIDGNVVLEPSPAEYEMYVARQTQYLRSADETAKYLSRPGKTADGVRIDITLNINGMRENELAAAAYTDGVGLFRTEFLFMNALSPPTEDEQYTVYSKVLQTFNDKPVILRTLDIGGDKRLPYMELPMEENPFLGLRGLRFCLANEGLFRTQLRAALRASVHGKLWIMFPMVGSLEDVRRSRALLELYKAELVEEGAAVASDIMVGIMIEIPSIALIADAVVKEVDFASIGTNDLCQYVTAADRMNASVAYCYQTLHPGLLRLISCTVKAFNAAGKPVCICGEMGGEPKSAALLVGLGMRKLSMGVSSVARIKEILSHFTVEQLEEIAAACLKFGTAGEVDAYCTDKVRRD